MDIEDAGFHTHAPIFLGIAWQADCFVPEVRSRKFLTFFGIVALILR
jgi:hypothetical protein